MSIKKIAICTDFSKNSEMAFLKALELADKFRAKLFVLHVMPPVVNPVFTDMEIVTFSQPEKSMILKVEDRMEMEYGKRINENIENELVVVDGHVSTEIINFLKEKEIDLVVTGSYGLTGMGLVLFGSVAKRITRKAPCSVLIVRESDS